MKKFLVKSPAKINISLNITGKRDDGYHFIDSVMLPISLHDSILFSELYPGTESNVTIDDYTFGPVRFNIVSKAMSEILKAANREASFKVLIHKVIPMQAGLGGGSSNAATTLRTLNEKLKLNVSEEKLYGIGLSLGADVPFFLNGKPARVRGIGEIIDNIQVKKDYHVLIVKPPRGCSTEEIFKASDTLALKTCNIENVIKALETGDDDLLAENISNALLEPALQHVYEIQGIIDELKGQGLKIVGMSGSGSSVFALSTDLKQLKKIAKLYEEKYVYELVSVIK